MITEWFFDSPARIRGTACAFAVAAPALLVALLFVRFEGHPGAAPVATPVVVNTDLVAPTTATATALPEIWAGPAAPIALVAVQAWIDRDYDEFDTVSTPEASQAVRKAGVDAPAGKVTGDVEVVKDAGSAQTLRVPTSGGVMQLKMLLYIDRWQVSSIKYLKR